ncbi:MFS transporter [Desertivirga brevis]|uniref:MFS transporter n=1 Tax=Desertivirga brevis TaxID=2810310 RepID=UPI001F6254C9|nr:MFS transporter [Pedobacter sp. SYSU D00873]
MENQKASNYRWTICSLLFFATTINYLDRQVLSLTWKDFIAPEFHWTDSDYGTITALFSIFYAASMLFAGRFVDWMDTKKGFLWAIFIWSLGACLHAYCGIATSGIITGNWLVGFEGAKEAISKVGDTALVLSTSVTLFIIARIVLAFGEAGNFPAAIKATAEFFPKKDRALATSIFNAGATVGALAAPVTIPLIAANFGWEMSFILIGALGFVWMGFWIFVYKKPHVHPRVNKAELEYIQQDIVSENPVIEPVLGTEKRMSFASCFSYKQTWAFAFGKFMTDGVWWFYLFWFPAYLSSVYGLKSDNPLAQTMMFVLYAITLLSIIGGWLPTYFVDKKKMNPYEGRMRSMLIFAFFPLLALLAQPLGNYSAWFPVIIIGIAGAAHQAWSANIFSTVGDMFPRSAIATVTGIGGMAGGLGSFLINKGSGLLFDFSRKNWSTVNGEPLATVKPEWVTADFKLSDTMLKDLAKEGVEVANGVNTGYLIIFSICAVAYLIGWFVMKSLVPKYKPIEL